MLVADRLHHHRGVGRKRAGMVGDEQRAARRGDVLDPLGLDPEPVAVVEVERRLDQGEYALGAAPVVERALLVGGRQQRPQVGQVGAGRRSLGRCGVVVGARVVPGRAPRGSSAPADAPAGMPAAASAADATGPPNSGLSADNGRPPSPR